MSAYFFNSNYLGLFPIQNWCSCFCCFLQTVYRALCMCHSSQLLFSSAHWFLLPSTHIVLLLRTDVLIIDCKIAFLMWLFKQLYQNSFSVVFNQFMECISTSVKRHTKRNLFQSYAWSGGSHLCFMIMFHQCAHLLMQTRKPWRNWKMWPTLHDSRIEVLVNSVNPQNNKIME